MTLTSHVGRIAGLLLAACLLPLLGQAYTPEPTNADYIDQQQNVFLTDEVTIVEITIDPGDFQLFLQNPEDNTYRSATVRWKNSKIDETYPNVAMRPRGNTSRDKARKSWKLDFKEFVPDRDFHGLEEVNLNGDANDPSFVRAPLSWWLCRQMGLPGSRTHYVALYVNGTFWSIQDHVEHFDEEFTDNWFNNKDGNFYKCLYQADKADLSYRPAEDYDTLGGGSVYSEKNNDPDSDYSDLADFIRFFNLQPNSTVYTDLVYYVNVDNFMRYLAFDVGTGMWDDYWYGSNNYYLNHNLGTDRFEWIPYDYDNTFGIDFMSPNVNWSTRDFNNFGAGGYGTQPAPLVDTVFEHSEWRRQYRRYLYEIADILDDPATLAKADEFAALIAPYYDGTIEDGGTVGRIPYSDDALTQPATYVGGSGATMGVKPFMVARAASLRSQLDGFYTTPPVPPIKINEVLASNGTINPDINGDYDDWIELYNNSDSPVAVGGMHLSDDVTSPTKWTLPAGAVIPARGYYLVWADNQPEQGVNHANYKLNLQGGTVGLFDTTENGRVLIDYLTYPDLITDRSFGRFPDGSDDTMIFETVTPSAQNDDSPSSGGGEPRTPPRLFINEFMATNAASVQDEAGEYADWFEVYNDEDHAEDLSGLHVTDDLANPTKFKIPDGTTIPSKGFLVFWCDNDLAQGPLHTGFKLSAGGESIGIFDSEVNNLQEIDSVTFGAQTTDVSMGLLPDGQGDPVVLDTPTPGASNVVGPILPEGWILH
ncbi:CotH kinase family protein [bacterium]|nr:CotH kinase family protein [bacterium]